MTPGGGKENARTLAALLGLTEEQAITLLDQRILVSSDFGATSLRFRSHLIALLTRTFTGADLEPVEKAHYAAEVVVGASSRRLSRSAPAAYVAIGADTVLVDVRPSNAGTAADCHELILFIGACYAAAAVAKLVVPSLPMSWRPVLVSAADLLGEDSHALRQPVDLGTAHLAGAGAVGNAFVYGLASLSVRGMLNVCDPDSVSDGNLNRCLLFEAHHKGENKAITLCNVAQPRLPELRLVPFDKRLEMFPAAPDGRTFRRLIVGVDSRRARRALQLEFAREVYDASTTGIEEVVLHFNRLPVGTGACLSCVYRQERAEDARERHIAEVLGVTVDDVRTNWISGAAADRICERYPQLTRKEVEREAYDSLFKVLCGQGALKAPGGKEVLAPFAFVSALAGALLALEVARRLARGDPLAPFNYGRLSPWGPPVLRLRALLPPQEGCEFCAQDVYQRVSRILWG